MNFRGESKPRSHTCKICSERFKVINFTSKEAIKGQRDILWVGHLPSTGPTQIQFLAPHMVSQAYHRLRVSLAKAQKTKEEKRGDEEEEMEKEEQQQ